MIKENGAVVCDVQGFKTEYYKSKIGAAFGFTLRYSTGERVYVGLLKFVREDILEFVVLDEQDESHITVYINSPKSTLVAIKLLD